MTLPNLNELKQLQDSITPGTWRVHVDENDADATYIYTNDGMLCMSLNPIGSGSSYGLADLELAALAPELLSEVIRMREKLEEWRNTLTRMEQNRPELSECTSYAHQRITRIMEETQK